MKISIIRIACYCFIILLTVTGCSGLKTSSNTTGVTPDENISVEPTNHNERQNGVEEIIEEKLNILIKADEELKDGITVLYQAYFNGENPVFVQTGEDLIATTKRDGFSFHPKIEATYLWNSILLPVSDYPEVKEFIKFSISIDGQQVLADEGLLIFPEGITDQAGNPFTINQPYHRVISTYGPSTAFIYAIGAGDRLVSASYLGARDPLGAAVMEKIDPRFPALMGDDYFSQDEFNIEQAAILEPDLIVTSARTAWLETAAQLDIPVFLYDAETIDRLKEAMLLTGQIFGPHAYAKSEAWVSYFESVMNKISTETSDIPEDERLRVLFTGTQPLRVASGDMFQTAIIELAGGVSVSVELNGYWNDVDLEQIAIWDPDLIIVPPYGGASVEAITESPEWQILNAVQSGRVYQMPKLVVPWDTPAPDSVLGIIWMANLLNPELHGLDCAEEAQYFYNTFYNYQVTQEELSAICSYE